MKNRLSFPRILRLTTKADYQAVFDNAKKTNHRFLLALSKSNQKSYARLGVMVGKRIAKSAAVRNRIKRTIRESFRHYQEKLKGFDVIVMARPQCDALSSDKLREGIHFLWEKLVNSSS